jgi:hypothetical protein
LPLEPNTTAVATPTSPVGQSFVACQNGVITRLYAYVGVATVAPVHLGLQHGIDLASPEFVQTASFPSLSRLFDFTMSYPVTAGTLYSFSMTPSAGLIPLIQTIGTRYPDGSLIVTEQGASIPKTNLDLEFTVIFSPDPVVPTRRATWGSLKTSYR